MRNSTNLKKTSYYKKNSKKLLVPFIEIDYPSTSKEEHKRAYADSLAEILDRSDNELIKELKSKGVGSLVLSSTVENIRRGILDLNIVAPNAPWLEKLEKKMRVLELFIAKNNLKTNRIMVKYNKLVRDKIPEILDSKNIPYEKRIATTEEYKRELIKKLKEEVEEFLGMKNSEELADIIEVIEAQKRLPEFKNVEEVRKKKLIEKGGFDKKIILKGEK